MPLPQLPTVSLDDINHRRRSRETINQILTHQFDDSKVRTAAEIAAGVTPVNYAYPPGDFRRYGADPLGIFDSSAAIQAACDSNTVAFDGYASGGLYKLDHEIVPTRYPLKLKGAALSYGSLTGTRFNFTCTTANAAIIHWGATAYGFRCEDISFTVANATLGQVGIQIDGEWRSGRIEDCSFSTTNQTAANSTIGIYLQGGGSFSGAIRIDGNNFANLQYCIFVAGSVTSLRIYANEILGNTLAVGSIGINLGDNTNGVKIWGNDIEGFNADATSRGINSRGVGLKVWGNRFEQCLVPWQVARGTGNPNIRAHISANDYTTCGASIYPQNGVDFVVVDDEGMLDWDAGVPLASYAGFRERGRTTDAGEYITPAFNAGNFTASGSLTWTVSSGQVAIYKASLIGHTITMEWGIAGSTAAGITNTALRILIPGGYTAKGTRRAPCVIQNNNVWTSAGMALVQNGVAYVEIYIDATAANNWTLSANTGTHGVIQFEVN